MTALCIFLLEKKHLMAVYYYLISVAIVCVSYWSNQNTVNYIISYYNSNTSVLEENLPNSNLTSEEQSVTMNDEIAKFFDSRGLHLILNFILQFAIGHVFCLIHSDILRFGGNGVFPMLLRQMVNFSFILTSYLGIFPVIVSKFIIHYYYKKYIYFKMQYT